jgi:hypothetical protein
MAGPRDDAILHHIGLYRLTLRVVLARVFFAGRDPGNVLLRLRRQQLIQERPLRTARGDPQTPVVGSFSYYQLTPAGAAQVSVPARRATPLATRRARKHLTVLWFCCMMEPARLRLEPHDLARLFGAALPGTLTAQVPHCLEGPSGARRIRRLYVPGARTPAHTVVRALRADVDAALLIPALAPWVEKQTYEFTILVESAPRAAVLEAALDRARLSDHALTQVITVCHPAAPRLPYGTST